MGATATLERSTFEDVEISHKRRATDRALERLRRAEFRGDTAAVRIAAALLDALLKQRAAYRRDLR